METATGPDMAHLDPPPAATRPVLTWRGMSRGARRLLPVAIFVIPFGIAFGVAAAERGLPVGQSVAMSMLVFSGAAQFAALEFWQEPVAFGSLALVVLAVNARHVVMGAALAPWVNALPLHQRILSVAFLSDPNFADSQPALRGGEKDLGVLLGGGLILWVNWVAGCATGALAGSMIGNPSTFGLDVVMTCFLAALVADQARQRARVVPVVVAALVAVATLDWLPTGWNVIVGALAGGVTGSLRRAG